MRICNLVLTIALLGLLSAIAVAEVPQHISYQGRLTDATGAPLDATASIVFTIYDSPTGSPGIWYSGSQSVIVENGLFTYQLGSVNPLPDDIFADTLRWLGIRVGNDDEISPRTKLTSVSYAYHALRSDTADFALSAGPVVSSPDFSKAFLDKFVLPEGTDTVLYGHPTSQDTVYITSIFVTEDFSPGIYNFHVNYPGPLTFRLNGSNMSWTGGGSAIVILPGQQFRLGVQTSQCYMIIVGYKNL